MAVHGPLKWTEEMLAEAFEAHFDHYNFESLIEAMNKKWGTTFSTNAIRGKMKTAYPDHSFAATLGQRKKAREIEERRKRAAEATAKLRSEITAIHESVVPPAPPRPDYQVFSAQELSLKHTVHPDDQKRGDLDIEVPDDRPLVGHLWPDAHVPQHDPAVVEVCTMFTEFMKPDFVVDLGDNLDLDVISAHAPSDLRGEQDVLFEVTKAVDLLKDQAIRLDKAGVKHRIFMEGNHEYRLHRFLCEKAPEIYRIVPTISDLLQLDILKWKYVSYGGRLRVGTLRVIHGERFNEHVAAGYVRKEGNVCFGHTHRAQVFVTKTRDGYPEMAMTCGTRASLNQKYQHHSRTDHVHGMGLVMAMPNGAVTMTFVPVIDGKIHYTLPDGEIIEFDGRLKKVTKL